MTLMRARQRVVTALFPHQANRRALIPNRRRGFAINYDYGFTVGDYQVSPNSRYGFDEALGLGLESPGNPVDLQYCYYQYEPGFERFFFSAETLQPDFSDLCIAAFENGPTIPCEWEPQGWYRNQAGPNQELFDFFGGKVGAEVRFAIAPIGNAITGAKFAITCQPNSGGTHWGYWSGEPHGALYYEAPTIPSSISQFRCDPAGAGVLQWADLGQHYGANLSLDIGGFGSVQAAWNAGLYYTFAAEGLGDFFISRVGARIWAGLTAV